MLDELVPRGAKGDIQSAVSAVGEWSREHCMQLNADKCKEMIFDLKNNKNIFSPVVVYEKELAVIIVQTFRYNTVVDYCNSLPCGLPAYQLNKLQRGQNAAARLIFQESKYCHVRPMLYNLHWFPVKFKIEFKILLLT